MIRNLSFEHPYETVIFLFFCAKIWQVYCKTSETFCHNWVIFWKNKFAKIRIFSKNLKSQYISMQGPSRLVNTKCLLLINVFLFGLLFLGSYFLPPSFFASPSSMPIFVAYPLLLTAILLPLLSSTTGCLRVFTFTWSWFSPFLLSTIFHSTRRHPNQTTILSPY